MRKIKFIFIFLFCLHQLSFSSDSLSVLKSKKLVLGISTSVLASSSLIYLNQAWYQQYNTSQFHFFNDNYEWFQLDKCGHAFTTYQTGRLMMEAMNWAGFSKKKQVFIGGLSGFAYMAAIELMDGYSSGWGFSLGDMAANTFGTGMAIGQKMAWNQQRIQLKFSYSNSGLAKYNPNLLGKNFNEQILKDYNAQTYWLSVNPTSFFKTESKFPKWLNFALGYGANGMINGSYNKLLVINSDGNVVNFSRYRQYYFSLDADLTRIKTKSKFLKSIFSIVNIIKIPFPNLELSENKLKLNYY